jgi:hypothetical protein
MIDSKFKSGYQDLGHIKYWYVEDPKLGGHHGPGNTTRLWCFETYGKENNPNTWSIIHETITFDNEQDYMLYVLTWYK